MQHILHNFIDLLFCIPSPVLTCARSINSSPSWTNEPEFKLFVNPLPDCRYRPSCVRRFCFVPPCAKTTEFLAWLNDKFVLVPSFDFYCSLSLFNIKKKNVDSYIKNTHTDCETPNRSACVLLITRSCILHFNVNKLSSSDFIPKICGNLNWTHSSRLPQNVTPQRWKSSLGMFKIIRTSTKWNWHRGSIVSKSMIGKFSIKLCMPIFAWKYPPFPSRHRKLFTAICNAFDLEFLKNFDCFGFWYWYPWLGNSSAGGKYWLSGI